MTSRPLRIGNVEIACLTDATFSLPLAAAFPGVPAEEFVAIRTRHPDAFAGASVIQVHIGVYWIQCEGGPVVIDTGIGPRPFDALGGLKGSLSDVMRTHALDPAEPRLVFHTHAHFDHVGWNAVDGQATFVNARHVLHRLDWETFQGGEERYPPHTPYMEETFGPLVAAGVLDLIDGEQTLTPELTAFPTPGHTPGHMSVRISSAGAHAILTGDAIVHPAQVTHPEWAWSSDMEPETAIATRRALLDRAEAEGMQIVACHFPAPGAGTIVRIDGKRYFRGAGLA